MKSHEIDDIYDTVDKMLWDGKFDEINDMIHLLFSETWCVNRCLTWLTATLPEKSKIVSGRKLLIDHIRKLEKDSEELLWGLE